MKKPQPKPAPVKPPSHLAAPTREWFASVIANYELDEHHVRLLTAACESWDRAQQARKAIAEHGLTFMDKHGQPRARPEVNIERDARIAFARLLRELALDVNTPADDSRPPRIGG